MNLDNRQAVKALVYRMAAALQKKVGNHLVGVKTEILPLTGRLVICFTLSDEREWVGIAYTESYFETHTKEHITWLVTTIYKQLKDSLEWANRGKKRAYSTDASESDQRDRLAEPALPNVGISKGRRNQSATREQQTNKQKESANPEQVHTEFVPAGIV